MQQLRHLGKEVRLRIGGAGLLYVTEIGQKRYICSSLSLFRKVTMMALCNAGGRRATVRTGYTGLTPVWKHTIIIHVGKHKVSSTRKKTMK